MDRLSGKTPAAGCTCKHRWLMSFLHSSSRLVEGLDWQGFFSTIGV